MSLQKRGNVYWCDLGVPGVKRVRVSTGTTDRKQAREFHDQLRGKLWREKKLGEKPQHTWDEAVQRWRQERGGKKDMAGDELKFDFFQPHFGGKLLSDITSDLVQDVVEKHKGSCAETTRNRYFALVRAIMRRAWMRWKWIDASQVPFIPQYDGTKNGRRRYLEPEELRRLFQQLPEHLRDIAMLAVSTGLRMSNVIGMQWSWVNLGTRTLTIPGALMKNGEDFAIPLNDMAAAVIERQVGKHADHVFVYRGRPVTAASNSAWYSALKRAGLVDVRFHDLRRTFASILIQSGASDRELQELGGWKSPSMLKRYAQLRVKHLAPAAGLIDRVLTSDRIFGAVEA
jgi:integrase